MAVEDNMLEKKVWAVVGATQDPEKYGSKIFRKLKNNGYKVYPVNPNYDEIDGDKCYRDLSSLPEVPEVVNMVVNPRHSIKVVEEAADLGIKNVWLQPGTHNEEVMKMIDGKGLDVVKGCVLVSLN